MKLKLYTTTITHANSNKVTHLVELRDYEFEYTYSMTVKQAEALARKILRECKKMQLCNIGD